jgi:two-component system, chemotaxis family, CheB/CheR fusion protein
MPTQKPRSPRNRGREAQSPALPGVNPVADDHLTPEESAPFPIVAIGASAGGLEAFTRLLDALPADTGMAFVMILHLSPSHESMLSEILGRSTRMPVREAKSDMRVEPNHVYVIPPGKDIVLGRGLLQLAPRTELRGQSRPIDHFMRSLAEEHGHKSVGVVLSGTANDGTQGLGEIKAAGGITFAQDSTAEQGGMPRSAISAGAVDFVLPPDEIARELARISRHAFVAMADAGEAGTIEAQPAFGQVLEILREHMGVDFANYKRNTLFRRITRRMLLHKFESLQEYARFLSGNPAEIEALYRDVLISVTSFFRNPETYEALKERIFPRLTEERNRHDRVRVWALGCSTGEEAYSIAMAFTEYLEASGKRLGMQVFATDLNAASVEKARAGIYAKGIQQDVSPERLRRFFVEVDGGYRIAKPIRDMCVFARQNMLADPPFSRIDLITCRNVLIYLEPVLQQKLIPILHYSLRSRGFLWLGGSETIGTYRDLFELVEPRHKFYAKKLAGAAVHVPPLAKRWQPSPDAATKPSPVAETANLDAQKEADRLLLARYAPPGVVVTAELDIVQFRGDTSAYLMPAPGRASLGLLKMVREGLLVGVRGAVSQAKRNGLPVRESGLRVRSNGGWRDVDVVVIPLMGPQARDGTMMVLFEESAHAVETRAREMDSQARAEAERRAGAGDSESAAREIARLKQELGATRDYLQSVIEQQEAANEELQSANEEVQSSNEELQSINEELETSKEEIQSSNEELATVNDELQNRNLELSESNDDFQNLLASVQMPIIMLGADLRIRRFTPAAEKLLNLIPADVGRPIGDIKLRLTVTDLEAAVVEVIETVTAHEREVQDQGGRWYSLRIRPYRTLENKIEGAVILLVDIDTQKRAAQPP